MARSSTRDEYRTAVAEATLADESGAGCRATGPGCPVPHGDTLAREVARRRTFAIVSHPDAGKTTLTEKLLLYAGAIELAGAVRARKQQRHATADWMALERQRGISITSTALQFEHGGCRLNLLDTPGHQDFSEDTYRTLLAVDSAVMVLDSAKGIEPQTRKLFAVCRRRRLPILTFINKLDHPGRAPLALLDEIERELGLRAAPLNWPIGDGPSFQGVYDRRHDRVLRFRRTDHNQRRVPVAVGDLGDPALADRLGDTAYRQLREELDLLAGVGASFDREEFLRGAVTPVCFGSALTNFGVEYFLDALLALAPAPGPRASDRGAVAPTADSFSGFVFKIQANMDPRHRDRMAFLRVCSGRFRKDMAVHHTRLGRTIRLARPHRLFARERETVDEAYPGDIVGLVNPGLFAIGDTLCSAGPLRYNAIPAFPPERFAVVRNRDVARQKQFRRGLAQLVEEGVVGVLHAADAGWQEPILAAVGELQFDVVVARLAAEYGVEAVAERLPHTLARRVEDAPAAGTGLRLSTRACLHTRDQHGRLVILFSSLRELAYWERENPGIVFEELGAEPMARSCSGGRRRHGRASGGEP